MPLFIFYIQRRISNFSLVLCLSAATAVPNFSLGLGLANSGVSDEVNPVVRHGSLCLLIYASSV
jgi:hypothetical protein